METWQIIIVALFIAGVAAAWLNNARQKAQEEKEFAEKVAANPELYYVSEGWQHPDPIEEVAEETPVVTQGDN